MSKPICMATWRYKKPDRDGQRGLKALLKYVTFREDAHHLVPENGSERWIDGGLGKTWREVYANSHVLAGQYILAHHFVLSPDPDLMALLPEDARRAALQELTIQTLTDWYHARDYAMPEASFVIHNRETTDQDAPGRQMLHTHIFCAGSIPTLAGRDCPLVKERDVVRNKGGLDRETNLNRIAEQNWATILDRELGLEWRIGRDLERHLSLETIVTQFESERDQNREPLPKLVPSLATQVPIAEPTSEPEFPNRSFDIGFF